MLKSTLCLILAIFGTWGCCRCPVYRLPISSDEVITGKNLSIPKADLFWDESVTYVLDETAAKEFKFNPAQDALTLVLKDATGTNYARGTGEKSLLGDVNVKTTDTTLTITIKRNTGPWHGKATFFFTALGERKPALGGLDPSVDNYGKPR